MQPAKINNRVTLKKLTCTTALGQRVKIASINSSTTDRYSSPSNLGCRSPKSVKIKSCKKESLWNLKERTS